ncbi:hypothetical protein HGB07_05705 [Candidatus Roizmanbacteria bacterium]|nr:hypothetical protein [Candidatus Roizmanbacteria bacterium]
MLKHFIKYGHFIFLAIFLGVIASANFHPGYMALGNDNFSPELDPALTIQRSLVSPAWRAYRALGVPSDSEQSDVFRASIFWVLEKAFVPSWFISQAYLLFTLGLAFFSMGKLAQLFIKGRHSQQLIFVLGGLLYTCSLLTVWVYFFPVQMFVAAFAFLPLVLWRYLSYVQKPDIRNTAYLAVASIALTTSALTATVFITVFATICIFALAYWMLEKTNIKNIARGLGIIILFQLFWLLPFIAYVSTNTRALQDSLIYRKITPEMIENETKYNTVFNTPRYVSYWIDTKEVNDQYTYRYRDWFMENPYGIAIGYLPLALFFIGLVISLKKRFIPGIIVAGSAFIGWWAIKGQNPPFGFIYGFFQSNFPVFAQVFRWGSSKFWPFIAVALPILGTWGIVQTIHKLPKFLKGIVVGGVVIALLIYIYPFFAGYLVRPSMFVKIPGEYQKLAQYLRVNDPRSRIYVAPEANTLYFRNYDWGFFGSVFLHYIIPNPVVEKALVIGSAENEEAFRVMKNAYYSSDPSVFANVLERYDVKYVLSDKHASKGDIGYEYDWENHLRMVEQNPRFREVWREGKLALYELNSKTTGEYTRLSPQHNVEILNTILSQGSYIFNSGAAVIYPFALPYTQITHDSYNLETSVKYQGERGQYVDTISREDFMQSPVEVSIQPNEVIVKPLFPGIIINGKEQTPQIPQTSYHVNHAYPAVSIDSLVASSRSGQLNITYATVEKALVRGWKTPVKSNLALQCMGVECVSMDIRQQKDSLIKLHLSVNAQTSVHGTVCVESQYLKRCLNKNPEFFVEGRKTYDFTLPEVVSEGDLLKVYVKFNDQQIDNIQKILSLSAEIYTQYDVLTVPVNKFPLISQRLKYSLSPGDTVGLRIPVMQGEGVFQLQENGFYPETSLSYYNGEVSGTMLGVQKGAVVFNHRESSASLYVNTTPVKGEGLGLIYVAGNNSSGIPANITLKRSKRGYEQWENKLYPKASSSFLSLFFLPPAANTYTFNVLSVAFGPHFSNNIISDAVFEVVPRVWYSRKLVPESGGYLISASEVKTIPTAYSPNWKGSGTPVLVNGWQQGWLGGEKNAKPYFWPNYLAWAGYGVIGVVIVGLLLSFLRRRK